MPTPGLNSTKKRLREDMKRALESVSPDMALIAGEAIANQLADGSHWKSSSAVAFFSPLPGEVDTGPLLARAGREGKRCLFPRMVPGRDLEFAIVDKPESLRPGRYGVLEPDESCSALALDANAMILVPGMAFDRRGGRLGRGAGYYDRALSGFADQAGRPLFVGVTFELQIVASVPMAETDVRMDYIVTEQDLAGCDERLRDD